LGIFTLDGDRNYLVLANMWKTRVYMRFFRAEISSLTAKDADSGVKINVIQNKMVVLKGERAVLSKCPV
jgi:hypothetical protein